MNAELRHIEAFVAVARFGSFTRAAAALRISQPALTVQVRQLEGALGVRLFDRNNRRVALTPSGRDLVAPFERILLDVDAVARHASDLSSHRRGVVTVAALPSIAAGLLPRAIRALLDRHDGLVIRVRDVIAEKIVDLVKTGEADFGIGSLVRPDPEIVHDSLFSDRICAFVPAGHVLARRRHVTLRQLSPHALILTRPESSVRQIVEGAFARERRPVQIAQEATYMTTALGMVLAGLGIAVLPESALASLPAGDLRAIPIGPPAMIRQIGILTKKDRSLSPAAVRLVDTIRDPGFVARDSRDQG
jgi:DNA-binding transcriptional LysR family regulator